MLGVAAVLLGAVLTGIGTRTMDLTGEAPDRVIVASGTGDAASDDPHNEQVQYGSAAVVLDRSDDGHFYADAQINGQTIRMLVDTGATAIALARDDARRAGVGISIGMPRIVGQGASGDVHGEVVSLDRVALGDREAADMPAVVLDDGQISLLGQNFLSKFESVEIKDNKMVLR